MHKLTSFSTYKKEVYVLLLFYHPLPLDLLKNIYIYIYTISNTFSFFLWYKEESKNRDNLKTRNTRGKKKEHNDIKGTAIDFYFTIQKFRWIRHANISKTSKYIVNFLFTILLKLSNHSDKEKPKRPRLSLGWKFFS